MSPEVLYRFNYHDYFRCLCKLLFKRSIRRKKIKNISYNASILFRWFFISVICNIEYLHFEVLGLFCGTSFNFDYIYLDVRIVLLLFERRYYTKKNYRDCFNPFGEYYYCCMIEIIERKRL